ncbi:kinase-like domain-containing protein [Mycena rosella]|uniref:non-specific serine/threonine protein kinase n=1 Tax=Mycena rosella TaxID=1033263 RepID=A0AAD7H2N1_MYCRO|nr:kinase-like domain-containing protein [Mycena rosella]
MTTSKYPKVVGYDLVQQIGGCGFSRVFRAVNVPEHRVAACKRKTIEKEMCIHTALKRNNILEFLNIVVVELKHQDHYVPGLYLLLELAAGGDLFDKIIPDIGMGDEVAHFYFNQVMAGMDYIHKEGVCHRDRKPQNFLLDVAGTLKISHFGLSSVFKLKDTGRTHTLMERCDSLPYVAPGLNSDQPYEAELIDVWGIGVILYTLLAGNTPWDEPTQHKIFQEQPWSRFSALIQGLLTTKPREQFTLEDTFQHPWCIWYLNQGAASLAQVLTQSLRTAGDLELVSTDLAQRNSNSSQTQSSMRYTPHLTRFYADLPPEHILPLIRADLAALGVTCRDAPSAEGALRLRIGRQDAWKEVFRGWVSLETFQYHEAQGCFCVMQKDSGNPISWRQLWWALIQSPRFGAHVLRKQGT